MNRSGPRVISLKFHPLNWRVKEDYFDWCGKYFGITTTLKSFGFITLQDRSCGIHEIVCENSGKYNILRNLARKLERGLFRLRF